VEGPENTTVYLLKMPLDDSARLALKKNSGPGSSEVDPAVFVIE